jgi:hypothetical protein
MLAVPRNPAGTFRFLIILGSPHNPKFRTAHERLAVLANTGRVVKTDDGYRLADG